VGCCRPSVLLRLLHSSGYVVTPIPISTHVSPRNSTLRCDPATWRNWCVRVFYSILGLTLIIVIFYPGVALSTLAITIHTFMTVFFRWQPQRHPWVWILVVATIWIFLFSFVLVGYLLNRQDERVGEEPFYGPTPYVLYQCLDP